MDHVRPVVSSGGTSRQTTHGKAMASLDQGIQDVATGHMAWLRTALGP